VSVKRARPVEDLGKIVGYLVGCPACCADKRGCAHMFSVRMGDGSPGWDFNGDLENPTFSPSMLARSDYGEERMPHVCHSFVRDGRIQYLSDCTHSMAGQTVDLPDLEEWP
jgi:hypothetical protein